MVIALLGVWTSVAVVWFELVDYEEVLGKLGIYDADGDVIKESAKKTKEKQQLKKDAKEEEKKKTKKKIEDFDIKDEKIDDKSKKDSHKMKQDRKTGKEKSELDKNHKDKETKALANDKDKEVKKLAKSLSKPSEEDKRRKPKERSVPEQSMPRSAEEVIQPAEKPHVKTEHIHVKTEPEDEIEALLHEVLDSQLEKGELDEEKGEIEKGEIDEHHEETDFQEEEEKKGNNELSEEPTTEQSYNKEKEDKISEITEKSSSIQEEPANHYQPKDQEEYDTDVLNDYSHVDEGTNEPEIPESAPENTEQPDHVEEEELEREEFTENTGDADVPDSVTEPIQSVHKEEYTEDHVAAQQHDTEVPVHTEDYSEDDIIDT
ncbi:hypothetical protein E2320_011452 [Naja naja]|nr:hypothetical protein E2320_011452 [Naja naja]